jgi:hypothetical protein
LGVAHVVVALNKADLVTDDRLLAVQVSGKARARLEPSRSRSPFWGREATRCISCCCSGCLAPPASCNPGPQIIQNDFLSTCHAYPFFVHAARSSRWMCAC